MVLDPIGQEVVQSVANVCLLNQVLGVHDGIGKPPLPVPSYAFFPCYHPVYSNIQGFLNKILKKSIVSRCRFDKYKD